MFSLEKGRLRRDLTAVFNILMRSGEADTSLFKVVISDRTQGNGMNLSHGRFRFDIRKKWVLQCPTRGWLGTATDWEVVKVPSLSEFQKHLDNALSTWCDSWGDLHKVRSQT